MSGNLKDRNLGELSPAVLRTVSPHPQSCPAPLSPLRPHRSLLCQPLAPL